MHYVVAKLSETIPPIHKYHSNNTQIPDKCPPNTQIPSKQCVDHKMTNKNNTRPDMKKDQQFPRTKFKD